jgi:cellulose synthase/poly-beta-1,6-N-acetylglucosamine synthase-like glycosyltransferase
MAYREADGAVIDHPGGKAWTATLAGPSLVPELPGDSPSQAQPARSILPRCPELDCVRHLVSPTSLALAELRAAEVGVGADRVLIALGTIDEETYLKALARQLSMVFEHLDDRPRESFPLSDDHLLKAARVGMLPLTVHGSTKVIVAPRELTVRQFFQTLERGSDIKHRIRFTTNVRLQRFIADRASHAIGHLAAEALHTKHPELSAATGRSRSIITSAAVAGIALFALMAPGAVGLAMEAVLGLIFLAWTFLRLLGTLSLRSVRRVPQPVAEKGLPVYTIVIALYREAAAVGDLIESLRKLNYPVEKLDIKLVLEPDDHETRVALASMNLTAPFEIIIAPGVGPKTKPKALNAALPFARGTFIAVYDAEDRPEPDQLRLAYEAFVAGDARLACVQARLTIDNTSDSWLTRLFTAEYAGLFDVFLPGLAAWRLPLPLGGSSNHFRTSVLRETGAWDPYNVTEDADLGMRMARLGYRTAVIQSTTYEEAPARLRPWLKQRTRWCKGWMQTWLVHMRSPGLLKRELGWLGFAVFQLLVGGTVLAALVHSLFVGELLLELASSAAAGDSAALRSVGLHAIVLIVGYFVSIVIGLVGLFRRDLLGCAWALIFIPVQWVLLSIAAWRALFQLVSDPYRWEKTEHGLAQSSRLAERAKALTYSGADRPQPPRASVSC